MKRLITAAFFLLAVFTALPSACPAFDAGKAGFSVRVKEEVCPYRVMALFVMPEKELSIRETEGEALFCESLSGKGSLSAVNDHSFKFRVPKKPGLYPLLLTRRDGGGQMTLNLFVMVPASKVASGVLNGYRIGRYPAIRADKHPIYDPPRGFVEVTEENRGTPVSPHFTLEQFLCKQDGGFPKYMLLRERLVLKLETLLAEVNERGLAANSFKIMSGYRTPHYNKAIGNVKYSRHLWGGAADIYIDEDPADGMMDDLNGDGTIDFHDAAVLYDIVDSLYGEERYEPFIGGLGRYRKNENHGPFVHVDVRGFRARWGD